jgi:ElaB/YqjD/DUF883 family membrane-anchored ribosome-binding protein
MADLRIGEHVDPARHERTGEPVLLPTPDFTTHGVIVGMTGSGKTGLALVLVEEVLSAGVPVLMIDPKGDLGNLLLTFPNLAPADFRPWINDSDAQKAGVTPDEYAAQQARTWTEGLAGWGIAADRIGALRQSTGMTIFTPGSTSGVPLDIVGSLRAPADMTDLETVHDEIEGYVSGLLGLVGIEADPLSSREHILLANLIETSWTAGRSLDLAQLVAQVPDPPIRKLGVFEMDTFFPAKDRMALAMRLNALLASPAFAAWAMGEPLDIEMLLHTPEGKPRAAIVSTAHLSDEERQFVTSLVLAKLVTWMRRQSGTTDLRVMLYMDEVAGYVPPTANPPTKKPIMMLMKQARAFGVGVVLATQNPVDVDYKALSNAGTWMIGRLQTERDKARLLDGLSAAAGTVDVGAVGDTISGLAKREFVLKRAGQDRPDVFTTRWAMSYLRGPLTREQISTLMASQRVLPAATPVEAPPAPPRLAPGSPLPPPPPPPAGFIPTAPPPPVGLPGPGGDAMLTPPEVAPGLVVRWLDPAAAWAGSVGAVPNATRFEAGAVARVRLLFDDEKADLRHEQEYEAVVFPLPMLPTGATFTATDYDDRDLRPEQPSTGRYEPPDAPVHTKTYWASLQRGLVDQLVRDRTVEVLANRELKLYGRVGETDAEFRSRCDAAADAKTDEDLAKLRVRYEPRLQRAKDASTDAAIRAQQYSAEEADLQSSGVASTVGSLIGGLFSGRANSRQLAREAEARQRAVAAAGRKRTTASQQAATKEQARQQLESELANEILAAHARWDAKAQAVTTMSIPLEKSDVAVSDLVMVWVPVA